MEQDNKDLKDEKSKKQKKKKKKKKNQGSCNVIKEKNHGNQSSDSDDSTTKEFNKVANLGKHQGVHVRRSGRLRKKQKSLEKFTPHKSQMVDDFAEEEKEEEFEIIPFKKTALKPDPVYSIDLEAKNSKSTLVEDLSNETWNPKTF